MARGKGEIWEITIWPISPDSPVHKLGLCNNWIYYISSWKWRELYDRIWLWWSGEDLREEISETNVLSFGHCPNYPPPPARNLGNFSLLKIVSKSIWAMPKRKGVSSGESLLTGQCISSIAKNNTDLTKASRIWVTIVMQMIGWARLLKTNQKRKVYFQDRNLFKKANEKEKSKFLVLVGVTW